MYSTHHTIRPENAQTNIPVKPYISWFRGIFSFLRRVLSGIFGKKSEIEIRPSTDTDRMATRIHTILSSAHQQQDSTHIELYTSEEAAFHQPPDACFECDETQILQLIDGEQ